MTSLRQTLTVAALAALTAFLIALTAATVVVAHVVEELPLRLESEIVETRSQLLAEVSNAQFQILKRVDLVAAKADARIGSIQADVTSQLARTVDTANGQVTGTLSRVDAGLAEVHELRGSLTPILEHAASVAKQVDEAAPLFLDCDHNADCAFSRFQGTSKAVEKAAINFGLMSAEVRTALPAALVTWQSIGGNVDLTAGNVARITKPHFYDNLLKGVGAGLGSAAIVLRH